MTIIGVAAGPGGLRYGDGQPDLAEAIRRLPSGAPIIVMIHGFRFDPTDPQHNPFRTIFAPTSTSQKPRLRSWPAALDLPDALYIGFGWSARAASGPFAFDQGFAEVYRRAGAAGVDLAELLRQIALAAPGRPIDIIAHSLGARVALSAMRNLPRSVHRQIGRMLLLGGAELDISAKGALSAVPVDATVEVYSFTTRQNDVFDAAFEAFVPARPKRARSLSVGLPQNPRILTIQLDHPRFQTWLRTRGIDIGAFAHRICHWSFYTDAGVMTLYRRLLTERHAWRVAELSRDTVFQEREPRWSRLRPNLPSRIGPLRLRTPRVRSA